MSLNNENKYKSSSHEFDDPNGKTMIINGADNILQANSVRTQDTGAQNNGGPGLNFSRENDELNSTTGVYKISEMIGFSREDDSDIKNSHRDSAQVARINSGYRGNSSVTSGGSGSGTKNGDRASGNGSGGKSRGGGNSSGSRNRSSANGGGSASSSGGSASNSGGRGGGSGTKNGDRALGNGSGGKSSGGDRGNGSGGGGKGSGTSGKGTKGNNGKRKKKPLVWRFIFTVLKIVFVFILIVLFAAGGLAAGAIAGYVKTAQPISDDELQIRILTSKVYDSKGLPIAELTGKENKNRELVLYKDIPQDLKDAYVAIEDERFFQHPGIDFKRIISAGIAYIENAGESGHGGSTITQQVVRNINMRFERSLARKVQEWYNALDLERRYSKWQILEMYMNIIYMGNGCYGVQSASMKYFGKEVSELSLAQCAYLAGITNSPGLNNPLSEQGNENAIERQHLVLAKMLDLKSISQKEHDDALIEELKIINKDESAGSIPIQTYFVDYVVDEVINDLIEVRGMSRELAAMSVYNFGYKIYTTQDTSVQNVLDEVFQNDKYFYMENKAAKKVGNEHSQAAMIIMDPYTGQIKGMYGGYGKKEASRTLNRATQSKRQPGSSIKPIAVYAPALDLRIITPATIIDDVTAYMKTTGEDIDMPYPINFDQKNWGLTSIRDAIRRSVNVIAATVWRDHLGPDKSIEYLKRVGIDREKERYVSLALGGLNVGVNPLIMSSAFVPFVNKGIYYKPVGYTKVEDSNGNILLEKKPNYSAAYDETTAFLMLDMLQEVTRPGGTAPTCVIKNAKGESIITGGKTGTTSLNIDKWFVGFTPYYVAATWYGYDNKIKKIEIEKAERNNAQIIWQAVMEKIHQNLAPKEFTPPNGLVKRSICIYSGKIATDICAQDPRGSAVREEYFIKGTEPGYSDLCTVHIKALVCTAAKDTWGRNLLVGPYCPVETVIEKVFIRRPVPYVPVKPDDKYPEDWIYEITDGEYCNIHGEPLLPSPESTPEVTGALPDETPPTTDETTLTPTP